MIKNKKNLAIIVLFSFLAASLSPAFVFSSSQTQSATVSISSAVGSSSAASVVISSNAVPVNTDGTKTNISKNATAFNGWSNKAGWTASVSSSANALFTLSGQGLVTSPEIALGPGCSSYKPVTVDSATFVTSGAKNNSESGQTISACYKQPISWADPPGEYTATFTYTPTAAT